jgi:hypothetical protein
VDLTDPTLAESGRYLGTNIIFVWVIHPRTPLEIKLYNTTSEAGDLGFTLAQRSPSRPDPLGSQIPRGNPQHLLTFLLGGMVIPHGIDWLYLQNQCTAIDRI